MSLQATISLSNTSGFFALVIEIVLFLDYPLIKESERKNIRCVPCASLSSRSARLSPSLITLPFGSLPPRSKRHQAWRPLAKVELGQRFFAVAPLGLATEGRTQEVENATLRPLVWISNMGHDRRRMHSKRWIEASSCIAVPLV